MPGQGVGGGGAVRLLAVALTSGLLLGWNSTVAPAQQSPDNWTGERRAVLPSGLTVQLDFSPLPGISAAAAPGKLAERSGAGAGYADGLRPGDPAETFRVAEDRPRADGSWRTMGTLQISFSRAVRNPRLHISGLAALATGKSGSTGTVSRLTVTGGSPSAPMLVGRTDWPGWTIAGNVLAPTGEGASDGASDGAGSLELAGTVTTASIRVEQRSTARAGSTTAPAPLREAFTVTLDEGLGTAPPGYGNVSHLVSDLFLGQDAVDPSVRSTRTVRQPLVPAAVPGVREPVTDEPVVELDHGTGRQSPWSNPVPPMLQPGRGEYQGTDPTIAFPSDATIGRDYRLTLPVSPGSEPATLVGWIDFDHNGHFDPTERVQTEVPAGGSSATLDWTVPDNATPGEAWVRLRIARDASQLVTSGGFADSGEVLDQRIQLAVAAVRKAEIAAPVPGAVLADARPEIRGEGAVQGATVAVVEGDATLCRARVGSDGSWSCRPDTPLGQGGHSLVPVQTTTGGVTLRGDAVRITVKTEPPAAPVLTVPEYTNDPGLLITGTGDPASTVSVTDASGTPGATRIGGELCSTAVGPDRAWSCLPVENLADGKHQLTPTAVDAAGNRTVGKPVTLVVKTAAPERPVLSAPTAGATLATARPALSGRAEPGATVTVTARGGGAAAGVAVCSAVARPDGSWTCRAGRDLAAGDQALVVTATDRAGNATSADAVTVRIAPATAPSPSPSPTPSPSASATPSASPSPSASASPSTGAVMATPSVPLPVLPIIVPPQAPSQATPLTPSAIPTSTPSPSVSPSQAAVPSTPGGTPAVVAAPIPATTPTTTPTVTPSTTPSGTPAKAPAKSPAKIVPLPGKSAQTSPSQDARTLALPPAPPVDAAEVADAHRSAVEGWRAAICGVLLMLAAAGLLTRRVFGRGPGGRRR